MPTGRTWSPEEDALALRLLELGGVELQKRLGRSRGSIAGRHYRLRNGLLRAPRKAADPRQPFVPEVRKCRWCAKDGVLWPRFYCDRRCVLKRRAYAKKLRLAAMTPQEHRQWLEKRRLAASRPEARYRIKLIWQARREARERQTSMRHVLEQWRAPIGNAWADYSAGTGA